jgi:hypothetical protein
MSGCVTKRQSPPAERHLSWRLPRPAFDSSWHFVVMRPDADIQPPALSRAASTTPDMLAQRTPGVECGAVLRQSTHLHSTLYRWTKFVTHTVSSVFAVGYAYSAALAPLRVADSRAPKPWRKAYGGHPGVRARYPENRRTRGAGCRGSLSLFPGGGGRFWRKRCPERSLRS